MKADELIQIGIRLGSYDDLESLKIAIAHYVKLIGFDYFSVVAHDLGSFTKDEVFYTHNYPPDWEEHYFDHNYFAIDPANSAGENDEPLFKWSSTPDSPVIQAARDFGIRTGITVPLTEPGTKGFASYASATAKVDSDMEINAYFISPYIYSAIVKLIKFGARNEKYSLTKREIECLKWVCDGKTSWEISVILSISERTVLFHFSNIQKKLNTTNRLQSVAKSIVMGLINA